MRVGLAYRPQRRTNVQSVFCVERARRYTDLADEILWVRCRILFTSNVVNIKLSSAAPRPKIPKPAHCGIAFLCLFPIRLANRRDNGGEVRTEVNLADALSGHD